jgi:hypothetical protein
MHFTLGEKLTDAAEQMVKHMIRDYLAISRFSVFPSVEHEQRQCQGRVAELIASLLVHIK